MSRPPASRASDVDLPAPMEFTKVTPPSSLPWSSAIKLSSPLVCAMNRAMALLGRSDLLRLGAGLPFLRDDPVVVNLVCVVNALGPFLQALTSVSWRLRSLWSFRCNDSTPFSRRNVFIYHQLIEHDITTDYCQCPDPSGFRVPCLGPWPALASRPASRWARSGAVGSCRPRVASVPRWPVRPSTTTSSPTCPARWWSC